MKHISMIFVAGMAFALVSCSTDDAIDGLQSVQGNESKKELVMTSFKAYAPSIGTDSRTSLEEGNLVYWNDGDAIAVSGRYSSSTDGVYKCTTELADGKSPSADFMGQVNVYEDFYVAFYPYELFDYQQGYDSYFSIPSVQQATAGTFAAHTNPSWAFTDELGGSLQFHNLGALVKFTLTGEDVKDVESISLTSDQEQATLSGDFIYRYNAENPEASTLVISDNWQAVNGGTVTLEGDFQSGSSYYFVIAPMADVLSEGFTLTFEKTDGTRYIVKGQAGMIESIRSSEILNIGEVSLEGANFTANISDFKFIAAVDNSYGGNAGWTKDEDGTVPLTEENLNWMASVTSLVLYNCNLSSLDYISYFTGLEELDCQENDLGQVDLNSLKNLRSLYIERSGVTELKIDELENIEYLYCANNKLEELNISKLGKLRSFSCSDNQLTSLDLSGQTTNINILNCSANKLSSLEISHLTGLEGLYCYDNQLTSLDLSGQTANLKNLDCSSNELSSLEVSHLTGLTYLYCSSNKLTSLELGHLSGLTGLYCGNNKLTSLDVENLLALKSLDFAGTQITDIDLSKLSNLEELNCSRTGISNLYLSCLPELRYLYCWSMENLPAELDLSANTKLEYLDCESTGIISLNVSQCPNLQTLYCYNNRIPTLDLRNNTNLNSLDCTNQQLNEGKKLDLFLSEALQSLWNRISAQHSPTVEVHFVTDAVTE